MKKYLEDFSVGQHIVLGTASLSTEEIKSFAQQYDPQSFHLDEEAAKPIFGGLIASGWQSASLCNRLLVDGLLGHSACMGSPGMTELNFLQPVRPGQQLTAELEVFAVRESASKPDRGMVSCSIVLNNDEGQAAVSMKGLLIMAKNPKRS